MIDLTRLAASGMLIDVTRPRDDPESESWDFTLIEAALAEQPPDPEMPVTADDSANHEPAMAHVALAEDAARRLCTDSAADIHAVSDLQAPDPLEAWLDAQTGLSAWLAPEPATDIRMAGLEAPHSPKVCDISLPKVAAPFGSVPLAKALGKTAAPEASVERADDAWLSVPVTGAVANRAAVTVEPLTPSNTPATPPIAPASPPKAPQGEDPQAYAASLTLHDRVHAKRAFTEPFDTAIDDIASFEPARLSLADGDAKAPVVDEVPPSSIMTTAPKAAPDHQIAAWSVTHRPRLAEKDTLGMDLDTFGKTAQTVIETTRPLETGAAPARPAPRLAAIPTGIEEVPDQAPMRDMPLLGAAPFRRGPDPAMQPAARQIVAALMPSQTSGAVQAITVGGVTEIALSPEELGQVRISVSGQDKPLVVIMAERPETLELLRRNAGLLSAELHDAGLEGGTLSFRDGPPPEPLRLLRDTTEKGTEATAIPANPVAIKQETGRLAGQRRIDIRI